MSNPLFDIIRDLSQHKKNDKYEDGKNYAPFVVNRSFSLYPDTIFHANEMNRYGDLDKDIQHDFYLNAVPSRNRYTPWPKKEPDPEVIEYLCEYYKYSTSKAKAVLPLLTQEQIDTIKRRTDKGG